jgi:putative DNA primase/helicase
MTLAALDNAFVPLTADEIVGTDGDDYCDGENVAPVPADAPEKPATHPRLGRPSAQWVYCDGTAGTIFEVWRFDPLGERKQFVPLSLWRDASGLRWRWKGVPKPRPLYGLDRLGARPDASVVICEGEKAADAAAQVFPNSVCVTSPGGSQSANAVDWSPLSGRRTLLWPDADEPGAKYASEVAPILAALGCDVSVVDAMALAGVAPGGATRDVIAGWDAADAAGEWRDLRALRKAALEHAKRFDPGPAFVSWGPFAMDSRGLTQEKVTGKGDGAKSTTERIAAPFEVIGRGRDPYGSGWGRFLRWCDPDGRRHERSLSDGALHGDPAALCGGLAEGGLYIARNKQRDFATYLAGAETQRRVTLVHRTGWHEIGGHSVFVLPAETIGAKVAGAVILDAAVHGPYEARGKLEDWQRGVAALASGHALPLLAISAALAGPLLHLAGFEGGGLNFFGPSSTGKTTLLQVAASVWGRGGSPGYLRAWRATANGLEGAAASATDTALILDELGQVEAREAAAALYSLANGTGKARAARDGALREPKTWRALILSSGELPTETKLAEDRSRRARAGQFVRMLDVPADREFGFGAFDNAGPDGDPAGLAKAFKQAAILAYGTAGPEFVRRLIAEGVTGEDLHGMVSTFAARVVPAGADGQVDRAAQRFGLVMAAGELAIDWGLTPWHQGAAREAAAWALRRWIELRGGIESKKKTRSHCHDAYSGMTAGSRHACFFPRSLRGHFYARTPPTLCHARRDPSFDYLRQIIERDRQNRQHCERREGESRLRLGSRGQDQVAESLLRADEFGDNGVNHRECHGNLAADQKIRNRDGHTHPAKGLPMSGAHGSHEIDHRLRRGF